MLKKPKEMEHCEFKKYNIFLKAYIKMENRQLQNLMILKSQNKSFINFYVDLFQ